MSFDEIEQKIIKRGWGYGYLKHNGFWHCQIYDLTNEKDICEWGDGAHSDLLGIYVGPFVCSTGETILDAMQNAYKQAVAVQL